MAEWGGFSVPFNSFRALLAKMDLPPHRAEPLPVRARRNLRSTRQGVAGAASRVRDQTIWGRSSAQAWSRTVTAAATGRRRTGQGAGAGVSVQAAKTRTDWLGSLRPLQRREFGQPSTQEAIPRYRHELPCSSDSPLVLAMADPDSIYNWRRLDDRITTSGQPTEAQLAEIRALGVRHVINLGLHTHEKALPDEVTSARNLGMTYIHIPVDFKNPTDDDFTQFCAVMSELRDVPIHVHCIANYRVSAFLYRYRRDFLGMDETQARADMEQVWQPEGVWATFTGR